MLWCMNDFIRDTLTEHPDCHIYFEWTFPCLGWNDPPMIGLHHFLYDQGHEWLDCRIDGCNYGMMDSKDEHFIKKKWLVKTTDPLFHQVFKTKVCPGGHQHSWVTGQETARSAYYPWKLVEAIARHWKNHWFFNKHLKILCMKQDHTSSNDLHNLDFDFHSDDILAAEAMTSSAEVASPSGPSDQEVRRWEAKIAQFHKAAGHPTNANLARLVKNAGKPQWKVDAALRHRCPGCEALRPGGASSGQIPLASTAPMFKAWQAVGLDTAEWQVPGTRTKVRFLLMIDLATKMRAVHFIKQYANLAMEHENAEDIIHGSSERWLGCFPKPALAAADSGKSFTSVKFHDFLSSNVQLHFPPETEPWAHGITEAAVQDMKHTASAIQSESLDQDPKVTLILAAAALNSTEYTAGYNAFQWAFGKQYSISHKDYRLDAEDYRLLVHNRQKAEEISRVLSKLANTTVRQPLKTFSPINLVNIWRKFQPSDQHQGARGGHKKSGKPHWIGPGRVIFQEVIPNQAEGDHRRHILWVLIGNKFDVVTLWRISLHIAAHFCSWMNATIGDAAAASRQQSPIKICHLRREGGQKGQCPKLSQLHCWLQAGFVMPISMGFVQH